jgi:hypothetical protein
LIVSLKRLLPKTDRPISYSLRTQIFSCIYSLATNYISLACTCYGHNFGRVVFLGYHRNKSILTDFSFFPAYLISTTRWGYGNGYRFYLCGHTHGGQICLPGGYPVIRHLRYGRKYYRGLWRYRKMIGYTSQGCGTIGIPIRFNTVSEVTLAKLLKG